MSANKHHGRNAEGPYHADIRIPTPPVASLQRSSLPPNADAPGGHLSGFSIPLLFILLLLFVIAPPATAQRATLSVDVDSVSIGEVFEIQVTVEHQQSVRILFDDPGRGTLLQAGDAELISLHRLPPEDRNGLRIDAARYTAAVFAIDNAQIGPLEIGLIADGDTSRIHVPGTVIPVRSFVDPDSTTIFGPAPPATFARGLWPWLVAFLSALALAAAVLLGMKWWKNRRDANAPLEPIAEARQTLQNIRKDDGNVPLGYARAADALRTYIARTWPIPARELTTRELAHELETQSPTFPRRTTESVVDILKHADQVKFAGFQPSPEQLNDVLDRVTSIVEALEEDRQRRLVAEAAQQTNES